jgi:farnesyl-diphosphate farnesyltransferase
MLREQRIAILEELKEAVRCGKAWLTPLMLGDELSLSERELLGALPALMRMMEQQVDRVEISSLWRTILEGQLFDLRRFSAGAAPLTREELEYYCWMVAGSVGESWTRLIIKNDPEILPVSFRDRKGLTMMTQLGSDYGKGLHLLNILRDRAADQQLGRIYLQEKNIPELMHLAAAWFEQGERYCQNLRSGRIRYASEMPLRLAQRTLARLQKSPETLQRKIARWEVLEVLFRMLPSLVLPRRSNPAS